MLGALIWPIWRPHHSLLKTGDADGCQFWPRPARLQLIGRVNGEWRRQRARLRRRSCQVSGGRTPGIRRHSDGMECFHLLPMESCSPLTVRFTAENIGWNTLNLDQPSCLRLPGCGYTWSCINRYFCFKGILCRIFWEKNAKQQKKNNVKALTKVINLSHHLWSTRSARSVWCCLFLKELHTECLWRLLIVESHFQIFKYQEMQQSAVSLHKVTQCFFKVFLL